MQKIAELCSETRLLFISGYTDDEIISRGLASPGMQLQQKPFSAQQLDSRRPQWATLSTESAFQLQVALRYSF